MSTTDVLADEILSHFITSVSSVDRRSSHMTFGCAIRRPFSAAVHRVAVVDSLSVSMGRVRLAWREAYDRAKIGSWRPQSPRVDRDRCHL